MADLSGQVALVTGANRGIGREIASALAAAGAVVIAGARNPGTLSDLIASFPGQLGAAADLNDLIAHADEIIENDLQILGMRFYESD